MNTKRRPLADRLWENRLWEKIERKGPDECWLWTGCRAPNGYGQINMGGRNGPRRTAHRVAYELSVGPIPDGLDLDHLCEVKNCCNPAHLEPVTRQDNMLRFHGKRTTCKLGHPLDGIRRYLHNGQPAMARYCKTCSRATAKAYQARRRAKAKADALGIATCCRLDVEQAQAAA